MAVSLGPQNQNDDDVVIDINTTPLIDVLLVLLVMLIITIPVQTHAVKLDMPNGAQHAPTTPPQTIRVDIDFDGTILWNGQALTSREELNDKFQSIAQLPEQPEVHVRPDKLATYKYVAQVLSSAQRLGITKIGIVGHEQFTN